MTMSQIEIGFVIEDDKNNSQAIDDEKSEPYPIYRSDQPVKMEPRQLSEGDKRIVETINKCLKSWYEPWKATYLANGREFKIVYDLMEALLHYEDQIKSKNSILSEDRSNAIAQAVARLVDYGNAILGIDIIIRANDETSSELDPVKLTTIELFQAHLRAHSLREKLLYDYFKKDRPNSISGFCGEPDVFSNQTSGSLSVANLQVPLLSSQSLNHLPTLDRSHKSSIGSNTSINTLSEERKTAQHSLPIEVKVNSNDLNNHIEVAHMIATISSAFSTGLNSTTRLALLPGILAKIESLLTVPASPEKLTNCFELLDALLNSTERLPPEFRNQEVSMISIALLKPIVKKVYIDDRDSLVEFQHAHWTTFLLSIIRLMSASDFNSYMRQFNNMADLGAFLKDYLFIVKRLISSSTCDRSALKLDIESINGPTPTYPSCWLEMSLLACSTFLTSMTHLYQILKQLFVTNLQMWISFIDCLVRFILQETLKPDRFMLQERQRRLAHDLRQNAAEYVWISWDGLTIDQKQHMLEDLIEPLLRTVMILDSRQRSILLPIFYDTMRCDYTSQYMTPRGSSCSSNSSTMHENFMYDDDLESLPPIQTKQSNSPSKTNDSLNYSSFRESSADGTVLTKFTHLIVGKLNTLMMEFGLGDEQFKDELCAALSGNLNPKYYDQNTFSNSIDLGQFRSMAKHTSDLLAEFIQICLDSRQANKFFYKHLYLLCLFRLILFFRDKVDRVELYLSNLYKLCYLHHGAGRYVEAGYTLLEHAKTLPWSDRPLEGHFRIVTKFFQTPSPLTDYMSLKTFLYTTIIEYFDQGQLWEAAIPICRELMDVYQFKTFEFEKLAQLLEKMSIYFNNIVDLSRRSSPEYFRVTFYGQGFPKCIRGMTTIYRGKPYEKLGDFQATMLSKYPDSKLLTSLAKPDESILNNNEARYLQINACSPIVDLASKFGPNHSKIDESILTYYKHNECDKFQFSRRISRPMSSGDNGHGRTSLSVHQDSGNDNFANMWLERITLTTNCLPGMLPFFPVYLIETSLVSPIESAIEDLTRTNDRLSCMVYRFKADKRQVEDVRLLGQLLLGVVDAAVNGGITKYEQAFFVTQPIPSSASPRSSTASLESNFGGLSVQQQSFDSPCKPTHHHHHQQQNSQIKQTGAGHDGSFQVDKLKRLIAQQVPLLDEAIRLHRDRVADIMRPQHEHLESAYKKLKNHVMANYSRYLPQDYSRSSTLRSYRSLARSPNRSMRSESRLPLMTISPAHSNRSRSVAKRMSDAGSANSKTSMDPLSPLSAINTSGLNNDHVVSTTSNIPYKQLENERRSLPFLLLNASERGVNMSREIVRDETRPNNNRDQSPTSSNTSTADEESLSDHIAIQQRPLPAVRGSIMKESAFEQFESDIEAAKDRDP